MKLVPETIYRVVNDDGTEVHSATAQKVNDIVQLMKDAKVLGNSSPVSNNVGMRIATAILSSYELRKKRTTSVEDVIQDEIDKASNNLQIALDTKQELDEEETN
jgi:cell division protein ZapA (FtsZ GTPase activity inhibitor)